MDVTIRKAKPSESHFLYELYESDNALSDFPNLAINVKGEVNDSDRIVWVALLDDKCIGTVALVLDYWQKDLADGKTIAMIKRLRVAKKYEGTGIAGLLNKEIEKEARALGLNKLSIEVHEENDRARSIYKHWGYTLSRDGYRQGELAMIKEL